MSIVTLAFHVGVFLMLAVSAIYFELYSFVGVESTLRPELQIFGKWKWLTSYGLLFHFIAYTICLATYFERRLTKIRDFCITTMALPVATVVVSIFWFVWHVHGRENVFPTSFDPYYPAWLNHVSHTVLLPVDLVQLFLVRHKYISTKKSLKVIAMLSISYTLLTVYIKLKTGYYLYRFYNLYGVLGVIFFNLGTFPISSGAFILGKLFTNYIHK